MNETAQRAVPHINHTPHLAQAVNQLTGAAVPEGLTKVANPMDVNQVRDALRPIGQWFVDPNFFFPDDPDGELHATEYLVLLATVLREHMKAGNHT